MARFVRRDGRRGQALVEFALVAPIFILIVIGIFDVGRGIYAYSTINNAAHEAVRLAIVDQNSGDITAEAVSRAVGVGVTAADVNIRWLDASYADVPPCNTTPRFGCAVEVTIDYQFSAVTPVIGTLMGTIDLQGVARQPIERTFASP